MSIWQRILIWALRRVISRERDWDRLYALRSILLKVVDAIDETRPKYKAGTVGTILAAKDAKYPELSKQEQAEPLTEEKLVQHMSKYLHRQKADDPSIVERFIKHWQDLGKRPSPKWELHMLRPLSPEDRAKFWKAMAEVPGNL